VAAAAISYNGRTQPGHRVTEVHVIFVKSVLTGVVAAILALVVWIAANILFALIGFQVAARSGAGGLGAVSGPIPGTGGLIGMALGFAAGFHWMWTRSMSRRT
jgi:hypothetical protein